MNRFFEKDGVQFDIKTIKTNLKALNNADLAAALSKTDWQVTRANDPTSQKPIDDVVMSSRQSSRDRAIIVEAEIEKAETYDNLVVIYNKYL